MDHVGQNDHLHIFNMHASHLWQECRTPETIDHFLLYCWRYNLERPNLLQQLKKIMCLDRIWRPYWVAVPNVTIKEDKFVLLSQLFYWQLEDWMSCDCDLIKFQIYMWSLKFLKQEDLPTVWTRSNCRTSFCSTILLKNEKKKIMQTALTLSRLK